jgi:lipopolysaccharide heptosyltransferase II
VACFLLVRFSSIGDVLLTTPLIRALRARHPDARLVFVTKASLAPLVGDNPHLNDVVTLAPGEPLAPLAARLRTLNPTRGLDLHGSLRSRALRWLVPCAWRGYGKRRLARGVLIATKIDLYGRSRPVAERYFAAARGLDVRPDGQPPDFFLGAAARARADRWIADHGLDGASVVAVAPGAAHATKRWAPPRWQAVVAGLRAAGYGVVCVGGPTDRDVAHALAGAANAAGELSLQETGAVLARARALISGDTGVMHMATGVGTPVVALFGPTVRQFGFFPYQAAAVVLQRPLDCRPCSAMGSARCPMGHHRCLDDIAPADALAAVHRLVA